MLLVPLGLKFAILKPATDIKQLFSHLGYLLITQGRLLHGAEKYVICCAIRSNVVTINQVYS